MPQSEQASLDIWEKARQELEEEERERGIRVQDGQILDLAKVRQINKKTFEFGDRKVTRYFYVTDEATYIIPKTLHKKLVKIATEVGKVKVKISVEGEGRKRSYDALPLVSGGHGAGEPSYN